MLISSNELYILYVSFVWNLKTTNYLQIWREIVTNETDRKGENR